MILRLHQHIYHVTVHHTYPGRLRPLRRLATFPLFYVGVMWTFSFDRLV
jgi:hypothetical protein